jgi:antitoxin component YwqK of YwqJK toxin-antitoxin module
MLFLFFSCSSDLSMGFGNTGKDGREKWEDEISQAIEWDGRKDSEVLENYTGWAKIKLGGSVAILVEYENGLSHGDAIAWQDNGNKEYHITYQKGKKHGVEIFFHENGNMSILTQMKEGKKDGIQIFYNEDGTEDERITWKNDERIEG